MVRAQVHLLGDTDDAKPVTIELRVHELDRRRASSLVIRRIAYRAARSGLITGVLLATARVAGETAPLLFTALSNQFFSLDLTKTMANLPVTINNFVQSPYAYWKQLAWSGALIITLTVLALNIGARILGAERTKQ